MMSHWANTPDLITPDYKGRIQIESVTCVDSIFSNLDRFNVEPFDDQTPVVMKVK